MRTTIQRFLAGGVLALLGAVQAVAAPVTRNFDEFTSPPVTCCFADSGIGPTITYPELTVSSGTSARVMNSDGWSNMQTSGANLYGTLDGFIDLIFTNPINGLEFDLINGTAAFSFTINYYDQALNLLETDIFSLAGFGESGSVGHAIGNAPNISRVQILGNSDFAIDTISFDADTSTVPEPGTIALMGLALAGMAARRRSLRK